MQARIRALEAELDALESDVHADEVLKDTDNGHSLGVLEGVLEGYSRGARGNSRVEGTRCGPYWLCRKEGHRE